MQSGRPQSTRNPFTSGGPPGQPELVKLPEPPCEHGQERRRGSASEAPEEHVCRLPRRKRTDHSVDQGVEVGAEPRTGPDEQPVWTGPRDRAEAEEPEKLLQVLVPALYRVGSPFLAHPSKNLPVLYP